MCINEKMIPVETIPRTEEGGDYGEWWMGVIYLIYCKNFCKCHSIPLPSTTINKKSK
jgi:hypothetical protein